MRKYIYLIAGLIVGYLLLSKESKLPDVVASVTSGFRKLWLPLVTGGEKKQ